MIGTKPLSMFRKSYLYYLFFIVIILTSISSCEKDDVHEQDALSNTKFVMKGSMSSLYDIQNNDVKLFNYLSVRAHSHSHTNDLQSKSGGISSNVVLDTASIQVLEGDNFKNYIFRVLPDSTQLEDVLKNYMLVVLKDSIQQQFMVTYPYVDHKIDTTNVLIEPIFGTDILNQTVLKCGGGSYQSVWIPGGYTDYSCREGRHNVDDGPGSGGSGGCIYYGGWGSASRIFYEGYFTTQYVEQQPCDTFDPGSGSNGGGGNGGSYTPPIDDEDEDELSIGVGITPNEESKKKDPFCKKVGDQLNDSIIKVEIDKLIEKRGGSIESGYQEFINGQRIREAEVLPNGNSVNIRVTPAAKGSAHYHPLNLRNGNKGVRVFSPKDLHVFISTLGNYNLVRHDSLIVPINDYYTTVVSETQVLTLKFVGRTGSIPDATTLNLGSKKHLRKYTRLTSKSPDEGFLNYINYAFDETEGEDMFALYETDDDGNVSELKLDENEKIFKKLCYEID